MLEIVRQPAHETVDLVGFADVQLDCEHSHAAAEFFIDVFCQLVQAIDATGREDELEVFWACPGKFECCGLSDTR